MLTLDLVTSAFSMLAGQQLTPTQAKDYVDLLGSREELIAHLALKQHVFDANPDLKAALLAVASSNAVATQTPRREQRDLLRAREASSAMEQAIRSMIQADLSDTSLMEAVEAARLKRFEQDTETPPPTWPAAYYRP
jgi:hypothetical protein